MEVKRQVHKYARLLVEEAAVDGVDIFCCDKTSGPGEIYEIYGHGMNHELKHGYRQMRLFEVDPFTDLKIREASTGDDDSFELGTDPRVVAIGGRAEKYWRFMAQKEIEIVGAATRRLLPGFYLVAGLHRVKRDYRRSDLPYQQLSDRLQTLKDMVSVDILSQCLRVGDGYGNLRMSLSQAPASPMQPGSPLSPREMEIARLICLGKQNKEIAYVTGLSEHTVENHLKRIYRKLEIHNRAALVAKMNGRAH